MSKPKTPRRVKFYYPVPNPVERLTHVKVTVYYDEGGMCYATYTTKPRGYYVSVGGVGVSLSRPDGLVCESFGMFSALASHWENADRFNAKRLRMIADFVRTSIKDKIGKPWEFFANTTADKGLVVTTNEAQDRAEPLKLWESVQPPPHIPASPDAAAGVLLSA